MTDRAVLFGRDALPVVEVRLSRPAPTLVRYAGRLFVFLRRENMTGRLAYAEADVQEVSA